MKTQSLHNYAKCAISLFILALICSFAKASQNNPKEISLNDSSDKMIMARFDESSLEFVRESQMPPLEYNNYINDIEVYDSEYFLLLTIKGIFQFHIKSLIITKISDLTGNNLFIDNNKNIYLINDDGLFRSEDKGRQFKKWELPGFERLKINDIVIDSKENFYLATENGLLVSWDKGASFSKIFINPENPESNENYFYKCFLNKNDILVCTSWFGVRILNSNTKQFRKAPVGSPEMMLLDFDSQGRMNAVDGVSNSVIVSDIHLESFTIHKTDWGFGELNITSCFVDSKDRIFVYSYKDLSIKLPQEEKFKPVKVVNSTEHLKHLTKIIELPSSEIFLFSWIYPFSDLDD